MYVEKLETTFGNGQFHIKIQILASLENLEEPAAVGPPPHMAAICCRQWRLSPFPGHVFISLPQFLPSAACPHLHVHLPVSLVYLTFWPLQAFGLETALHPPIFCIF